MIAVSLLETSTNDSLHTSATIYSTLLNADLISDPPAVVSTVPHLTNFDILNEEFGAGIEAMSFAKKFDFWRLGIRGPLW